VGPGVRNYRDLIAWQLAEEFKKEVFTLVQGSQRASNDFRDKGQLNDAASSVPRNIAEGFLRYSPGDLSRFLDYSLGSLAEAEGRLSDGIELEYFDRATCEGAFRLARRGLVAMVRLKRSQRGRHR
jgi:four helix bundle protein